jgi:tetratricopeptide (TPR) repeat protein
VRSKLNCSSGNREFRAAYLPLLALFLLGITSRAAAQITKGSASSSSDKTQCSYAKPDVAIIVCTHIIEDKREDEDIRAAALRNRASFYEQAGDFDRATADYTTALKRPEPNRVKANLYLNRGLMYFRKGDQDRALADYGEAVTLDPKLATAYINRSAILIARGDNDGAIADLDRVILLNPKDSAIYVTRGEAFAQAVVRSAQSLTMRRRLN